MNTDRHGYQASGENQWLTQRVDEECRPKSVCIRVHPWFMNESLDFICGAKNHCAR